jgi:hypothetical protein
METISEEICKTLSFFLMSVIPAEAGIQKKRTGFRIKCGMTDELNLLFNILHRKKQKGQVKSYPFCSQIEN